MTTVALLVSLFGLLVLSAFFSSSETAMMALNRYRMRHLAKSGHRLAKIINRMLERPDRLLGVILIGNTFANILAASIATILASHWFGEWGIAMSTVALTLIILIFAEVTPKTFAAIYPQRLAFWVAWPLYGLRYLLYPIVLLANTIANGLLKLIGVDVKKQSIDALNREELRTLVSEAGQKLSLRHQTMLLGILELSDVTVEDIMLPTNEIVGIDLSEDMDDIVEQLASSQHTRLPIYDETIDAIKGILHVRKVMHQLSQADISKDDLLMIADEAYFIPETTSLNIQLLNFQARKQRSALVVDEYGAVQGLVTLDDILEEIVGNFTTDYADTSPDINQQADGSYMVDGTITLRELNRALPLNFPTQGAKTLSGLITEHLEMIPPPQTCLQINNVVLEIIQIKDNLIKSVRVIAKDNSSPEL